MKISTPSVFEVVQYSLIIMKLLNIINQSWYLIFIPTYMVFGTFLLILLFIGLIVLIDAIKNNNKRK
jgi:hypothetical protein